MSARIFSDYLREVEKGRLLTDLSEDFQRLVQAVSETGQGGSLTLRLAVKPQGGIDAETVTIMGDVKTTLPREARAATLFFVTPEFNLSRRDQRQMDLDDRLRAVEEGGDVQAKEA